ncbi:MAG TPA: gfo/Idh/MocA family oxidoreductase [Verrucomicrobiales bacterium]|mgnify:CR=1 FL=1|nr:gfo/Idh/MocA family oxidoreductase [Verrucomicrobiales bacterium]
MNGPLRLGVIGCGNVLEAYRASIERLRGAGKVEVTCVCGREGQREAAVAGLRAGRFTTEAGAVINAPDVDAVLILTPMPLHASLARAALDAGKHVVVEKPLATTLEEASELLAVARRSPGELVCAPFTLLSPTFQAMARRIRSGQIGRPVSARARYGWSGPWWSDWFYKPGGGCLFDLGVYSLTSLTGLLGPATRVMAMAGVAIPEREINGRKVQVEAEDNAQVLLDFGQGAFGVVTTGFTLQQYRSPALEVYGTTGTIQMLGDDWDPEGYELWQNEVGAWQLYKETAPDWSWTDGLRHLVDSLREGTRPLITPEHALHVLEIMIKARESSRQGRALSIDSRFETPSFPGPAPAEAAHRMHDRSREHTGAGGGR